jgi:4-hydroxy-4-methyl-2-oxoglutarate aldolase
VEIVCGGVAVRPGDVIAADTDGVLVIPKEAIADVARVKQELTAEESEVRRKIESGVPLATAYSYR